MCSIIKLATTAFDETSSYWSAQKAAIFSAFHWSPHGYLITICQHFVTTRVVHLPKRTETSLITESDQSKANHQLLQLCTVRTAWSDSDQAVRAVHSCNSLLLYDLGKEKAIKLRDKCTKGITFEDTFYYHLFCQQQSLTSSWLTVSRSKTIRSI